jgi:hypothetical protein
MIDTGTAASAESAIWSSMPNSHRTLLLRLIDKLEDIVFSMLMPPLIFRQVTFQAVQLGRRVIEVFTDYGSSPVDSLSQRREQILVKWLVGNPTARGLLSEVLQRSTDAFYATEVRGPFYGPSEGDIDLLVCNRESPHEAVVLECKRLKVEVVDGGNDRINKLEEVGEGVRQAKKLHDKFTFFQTYLAVISAVDAANRREVNIPCRGVTSESVPNWDSSTTTFRSIVQFPRREELPADIGIIFIELVQPSGRRFEEQGTIRICVHHQAMPRLQLTLDTRKIETLMKTMA